MIKILKHLAIASLSVGGLALLFPSYLTTAVGYAGAAVKQAVPIEFEIERAGNLISGIGPQVEACKRQVAASEVALEQLESDVAALTEKVELGRNKLANDKRMLAPVPSDGEAVPAVLVVASNTRDRVAVNLARDLESLKNISSLLASKQLLLERQRKSVTAAHDRLQAVRTEKARLEDLVANLRLQKEQVDALAAQAPNVSIDDSALSKAKEVLNDIKQRLDVSQRMLENDMVFTVNPGEPPLVVDRVVAEVEDFLAGASHGTR